MPIFEQASLPSFCRAQTRQPSVHSRQPAGRPLPCTAGATRLFGKVGMSAASAALANANRQSAIRYFLGSMKSKPKLARIPLVLPAGEPALAELQVEPLVHPRR